MTQKVLDQSQKEKPVYLPLLPWKRKPLKSKPHTFQLWIQEPSSTADTFKRNLQNLEDLLVSICKGKGKGKGKPHVSSAERVPEAEDKQPQDVDNQPKCNSSNWLKVGKIDTEAYTYIED